MTECLIHAACTKFSPLLAFQGPRESPKCSLLNNLSLQIRFCCVFPQMDRKEISIFKIPCDCEREPHCEKKYLQCSRALQTVYFVRSTYLQEAGLRFLQMGKKEVEKKSRLSNFGISFSLLSRRYSKAKRGRRRRRNKQRRSVKLRVQQKAVQYNDVEGNIFVKVWAFSPLIF